MDYKSQFNDTLVELVEDLTRAFPRDNDFQVYKIALQGAIIADSSLVHRMFRERVCSVFGERILARDEGFFLNNSYEDMKQEFSQADRLITKLKNCWSSMDSDQRAVIWKYLRVLVLLDRKIV
jgi:hypothetical protein